MRLTQVDKISGTWLTKMVKEQKCQRVQLNVHSAYHSIGRNVSFTRTKRIRRTRNFATFEACESIEKVAEAKNNEQMLHTLRGVNDLIAAGAKYHKSCYGSYTSKSNLRFQVPCNQEETKHDEAFND